MFVWAGGTRNSNDLVSSCSTRGPYECIHWGIRDEKSALHMSASWKAADDL